MTLNITSKQMDITPALRHYIEDKFAKLNKWRVDLINPHIVLSKEPGNFVVDATLTVKGNPLVASAKNNDMYNAINELITKLERLLSKSQHKPSARRSINLPKYSEEE